MRRTDPKMVIHLALIIAGGAMIAPGLRAQETVGDSVVRVGKGGYTLVAPQTKDRLPDNPFITERVKAPLPSTSWATSVHWQPFSSNHYAHPLAMRADKPGLRVSYPGPDLRVTKTNFEARLKDNELTIGHSGAPEFPDARLDGYGDWTIRVEFKSGANVLRTTYGHGLPFIFVRTLGGRPVIRLGAPAEVWSRNTGPSVVGLTVSGKHYALFGLTGSKWTGLDGTAIENVSDQPEVFASVALLPDKEPATLKLFEKYAYNEVVDTQVAWSYTPEKALVEATYSFKTASVQGKGEGTLFALYPHQWLHCDPKTLLPQQYACLRGPMKMGEGTSFTTRMTFPGILPVIPAPPERTAEETKRLGDLLRDARAKKLNDAGDTYWTGKGLDEVAQMATVAEQLGDQEAQKALLSELKGRLERWFTPPAGAPKKDHYFYYKKNWGTLIGQNSSYGSEILNDHHFHYGYFIRTAAEVARHDPEWAKDANWGGMVRMLIRDIASSDRADPLFPFLRCFDIYAGHSWAGGSAINPSGNNQESVSEGIQAWTGLFLWAVATNDTALRDQAAFMYTTEVAASDCYWFDVDGQFFPKGYERSCAVLVFGAASAYATWFSGKPEHCHGIILLPIQPGSLYLGRHPEYIKRNLECLTGLAKGEALDWMEIFSAYQALVDPDKALTWFDAQLQKIDVEKRARTYHWITALRALGQIDTAVTADHPCAMAFKKNGKQHYVVYNHTAKPMIVTFSNGTKVEAKANGATVK